MALARRHWGALAVVTSFVVSRLALANIAGLRFDNRPLNDAAQLLDRGQLRDNLVESLLNLHAQPPLFNLFVGLGLRAPSELETPLFHAFYLAVGLGIALCLYAVLRRAGVATSWAVVCTVLFSWSPGVFLYESWLHYDHLVVLLLVLSVVALQRYAAERRPSHAALFACALGAVVLTRSLFHLAWLLAAVALLVVMATGDRRRVLAAVSIPVLIVVGFHFQRLGAFGTFALSSSLGGSLARITVFQLPEALRETMVDEGRLSAVSLVEPFSPLASYDGLVPVPPRTGVPVLDEPEKATYENPPTNEVFDMNHNSLAYLAISQSYLHDAVQVIRTHPGVYVAGVQTAIELFFRPTSDFFTLAENRARVAPIEWLYNKALLGVVAGGRGEAVIPGSEDNYRLGPARTAWTVVASYVLAVAGGAVFLLRSLIRRPSGGQRGVVVVVGFLWFTTVYVFLVSNLIEVGENNRFRLYSDPLVLMLLATLIMEWRRGRARRLALHDDGPKAGDGATSANGAEVGDARVSSEGKTSPAPGGSSPESRCSEPASTESSATPRPAEGSRTSGSPPPPHQGAAASAPSPAGTRDGSPPT